MKSLDKKNITNFVICLLSLTLFLVVLDPSLTGDSFHEWVGLIVAVILLVHLVLHWDWMSAVTRRFVSKMPLRVRLNAVFDALFFVDVVAIMFSGLMISRVISPWVGIETVGGHSWKQFHALSAQLSVFLLGLHLSLHWRWLVNMARRIVLFPLQLIQSRQPQAVFISTQSSKELER